MGLPVVRRRLNDMSMHIPCAVVTKATLEAACQLGRDPRARILSCAGSRRCSSLSRFRIHLPAGCSAPDGCNALVMDLPLSFQAFISRRIVIFMSRNRLLNLLRGLWDALQVCAWQRMTGQNDDDSCNRGVRCQGYHRALHPARPGITEPKHAGSLSQAHLEAFRTRVVPGRTSSALDPQQVLAMHRPQHGPPCRRCQVRTSHA